jgi:hypothetical protein
MLEIKDEVVVTPEEQLKLLYPHRPWESEPDRADWVDDATGYKCRIVRNPISLNLNGYVGVPKGHALWGEHYNNVDGIDVHGGITYSEEGDDGHWWFGFDTAHADDFSPGIVTTLLRVSTRKDIMFYNSNDYKTWEFVEDEISCLAEQLRRT